MDAIATLSDHVLRTRWEDLSAPAVRAARTFVLDSLGVGVAGSAGPWADQLVQVQGGWGAAADARNWGRETRCCRRRRRPCATPTRCTTPSSTAYTRRRWCIRWRCCFRPRWRRPSGRAASPGAGWCWPWSSVSTSPAGSASPSRSGLRFFRPGTAGAFAATAAVGRLMRFDADTLVNAMGITLAQLCGTMQAHLEGSPVLALQVGFNARNAVMACDMAARGLVAPHEVLEGRFGYFKLFEGEHDRRALLDALGQTWRITEVAHKPYPSGRATHGIVDAVLQLKAAHGFAAAEVVAVACRVPPLVTHLVGRPVRDGMAPNYARLCAAFVAAGALLRDAVHVEEFRARRARRPADPGARPPLRGA